MRYHLCIGTLLIIQMMSLFASECLATNDMPGGIPIMKYPVLQRDPKTTYELRGFAFDYIKSLSDNWLKVMLKRNPRVLNDIRDRNKEPYRSLEPWAGEFAGKHLTGLVEVYRLTHDPELRNCISNFVAELISLQADDGYLGVFPDGYELTGKQPSPDPGITCDAWNHYHIMLGLILWYRESGDINALNAASKIGDLMCSKFLGKPGSLAAIGVREFNLAPSHGLVLLYNETHEKRYLDLAIQIVEDEYTASFGSNNSRGLDFINRALEGEEYFQNNAPGGARWENMHSLMSLSELYWITGNAKYAKALEKIWWSMDKTERHNNGGWGSMEQAVGSPYDVRPKELCCGVAWTALGVEMLKLTGNPIVADELELTFMNFVLAYTARSGLWQSYNVPSDGRITTAMPGMGEPDRPDNSEICCCTVNGARGFGLISEWALLQDKDGLALNWYGESTITAHMNNVPIEIYQETDYPRTGKIVIHVNPDEPSTFVLKLRVPHWSLKTSAKLNGEFIEDIKPGTYLAIRREWKSGDTIDLHLDMSVRYWAGEKEDAGRVSFYRGPVLLAIKHKSPKDYLKFSGDWGIYLSARHLPYVDLYGSKTPGDVASFEFEGDSVSVLYNPLFDCGMAEIKIDGKQAATIDMYGPIDHTKFEALFDYSYNRPNMFLSARWDSEKLEPGKHKLEITVLPEKNEKSVGNWVNIREIVTEIDDPVFDVNTLNAKLLPQSPNGYPIVEMEFYDTNGNKIQLVDFDSATEDFLPYISWIKAIDSIKRDFTKDNPTRSLQIK